MCLVGRGEIEKMVGPYNFLYGSPKFNLPTLGRKLNWKWLTMFWDEITPSNIPIFWTFMSFSSLLLLSFFYVHYVCFCFALIRSFLWFFFLMCLSSYPFFDQQLWFFFLNKNLWSKCKTHPLSFTFCHFNFLSFNYTQFSPPFTIY